MYICCFYKFRLDLSTYLVHFDEPFIDDLLLSWTHGTQAIEEGSSPHDLRNHNHLVDQSISISDQLLRLRIFHVYWLLLGCFKVGIALKLVQQESKLPINAHRSIFVVLLLCSLRNLLRSLSESLEQLLSSIWRCVGAKSLDNFH